MPMARITQAVHALQRGIERLDAETQNWPPSTALLHPAASPVPDETCEQLAADVRRLASEADAIMVRIRNHRRDRDQQ